MIFLIVLVALFIFLFVLYFLTHDDFVLLRKDIALEKVFNLALLVIFGSIFSARLFYVVLSNDHKFINPLVFLSFFRNPGFSLTGGVVGGILVLILLTRSWKMPILRLFDFFAFSFLCAWGIIGLFAFRPIYLYILYIGILGIFTKFLLPWIMNGKFKEGTITFLFLICFSIVTLVSNAFPKITVLDFFQSFENLILIATSILSAVFLIKQENLLLKIKKFGRKK